MQLYKLYHKNTNSLFPSYFNSCTTYYDNVEHNHDLMYAALRLPITIREYFVQSTKYQFLKLIRETSVIDLNRTLNSSLFQFASYFKYAKSYDPVCRIVNCYVCGWYTEICLFSLISLVNNYILSDFKGKRRDTHNFISCKSTTYFSIIYHSIKTGYSL